jgi:hypothetical protein
MPYSSTTAAPDARQLAAGPPKSRLADFTTDRRVLMLIAMALVIGMAGTFAAGSVRPPC